MPTYQKPGEKPITSGEYQEVGPRGRKFPDCRIVTIEPGDNKLPPTQKPGNNWLRIGPPKK